jgi:hypothetical protein
MATISLPSAQESQLEALAALPLELALREAVSSLVCLADNPTFLNAHVLPLLQEARESENWYVPVAATAKMTRTLCRSSSGLREVGPRSTTTPPGGPTAVLWDPSSKSATIASTTARNLTTLG